MPQIDYTFTRRFGIQIEAYNCTRERLAAELREAGINVAVEGYNHTTCNHWKLVTDASLTGNDTFELVSPVLEGKADWQNWKKYAGCSIFAMQRSTIAADSTFTCMQPISQWLLGKTWHLPIKYRKRNQCFYAGKPP